MDNLVCFCIKCMGQEWIITFNPKSGTFNFKCVNCGVVYVPSKEVKACTIRVKLSA